MSELNDRLLDAAFLGDGAAVQDLLDKGASVNAHHEEWGDCPLHRAAMEGHTEVALLLLARGADVNAADADGTRPLHFAAEVGHVDMLRLLIEHGAQVKAVDSISRTAADWAEREHQEAAKELLKKAELRQPPGPQRSR